jgi:hypothetical protein
MASVLDFERYEPDLQRQLLRRIGYTNGLHKIHRFLRVAEYLYPLMPTSAKLLAEVIIRQENERWSSDRPLKGSKYAVGIVDVALALGLIERFGRKLALSSEGYAAHALFTSQASQPALDAFLLQRVIEADGEYTLNVLRIVSEGSSDVLVLGQTLLYRFARIIDCKTEWAGNLPNRYAQRQIQELLKDAKRTLDRALNGAPRKLEPASPEFFIKHTVKPRVEWLQDLGCISDHDSGLSVTQKGRRLLAEVQRSGHWKEFAIVLPLDSWLADQLQVANLCPKAAADDFSWRIVAAAHAASAPIVKRAPRGLELLQRVRDLYSKVKLATFNEADALSIYLVFAALEAAGGAIVSEAEFSEALATLTREFPSEVVRLSKRRGRGMYVALKTAV